MKREYCISTALLVSSQVVHISFPRKSFFCFVFPSSSCAGLGLLMFSCMHIVTPYTLCMLKRVCLKIMQKISTIHFTGRDQYITKQVYTRKVPFRSNSLEKKKDEANYVEQASHKAALVSRGLSLSFYLLENLFYRRWANFFERHDLSKQFVQFGELLDFSPSPRLAMYRVTKVAKCQQNPKRKTILHTE